MAGPRSSWTGPLTFAGFPFGVVAYPVLASASKTAVKTLCTCHGAPIKAPKTCATSGAVLGDSEQQKGVEQSKGAYVIVDAAALDAASGPKSTAMVPQRVVHLTSVPLHLSMATYRLVPEPGHEQSVAGLRTILEQSGKALEIAGFVMRNGSADTVMVVYSHDGELLASTIADQTRVNPAPTTTASVLPDAQLAMLRQALDSLYPLGDFDVTAFASQFTARKAAAIAAAIAGTTVTTAAPAAPAAPAVPDLMAALEASLKAVKKEPIAA